MSKWTSSYITIIIWVFCINTSIGQSRSQLEKERDKIIQQIEQTSEALENVRAKSNATLNDLETIEAQINNRNSLRKNIQDQLSTAEVNISKNNSKVIELDDDLMQLKNQFNQLMRGNYLRKMTDNKWAYIFSSSSVNEAFLRWRYAKQYEEFINQKSISYQEIKQNITLRTQSINEEKEYVTQLLEDEKNTLEKLKNNQKEKDKILASLQNNTEELETALKEKQNQRNKLNDEIERVIIAELSKAKETTTTGSSISKKGLSWPVQGYISKRFGKQKHPSLKNVTIDNNGIDIASTSSATVSSVANGKVISVSKIPGYDNMIIIQHGEYYSVYSKVNVVIVQNGDFIQTGQTIGRLANGTEATLHFEFWKGKSKLDPQQWIKNK